MDIESIQKKYQKQQWSSTGRQSSQSNGCGFCKRNKEPQSVYANHQLKDSAGQVTCPQLFKYRCELCGSTGKEAHTRSYCPQVSSLRRQQANDHQQQTHFGSYRFSNATSASSLSHYNNPNPDRHQPAFNLWMADGEPKLPSQERQQDNSQAIRLSIGRQFRNMSRVTNSKYNSAGRLRHKQQVKL